ncbi:MAG: enoyl-CoA hydratase/isomerase family protein [Flammeovirgaceae bacterium]
MEYQNLKTALNGGIFTITINRPAKLNALNVQTMQEIDQAFEEVYNNDQIQGVIVTGVGEKAFVAGADISEIADLDALQGRKFAEKGQEIFAKIENCQKPVIAAVNGFALGGGCELAMACHMRVAAESARFGQPEVKLGIIPGYGGTQRLTALVGKGKAIELMTTADIIGAAEAKSIGLVNHVVSAEELMPKAKKILGKIAKQAPLAVGMVIDSVNAFYEKQDGYQTEANCFGNCCKTEDFKEGTQAFMEKREAEFIGK